MNDRYDDLDDTHPDIRFLIFKVPVTISVLLCHMAPAPFNLIGLVGICSMAVFRIIPFFFRRKV